ncbi:MAG TPA: hypothetical protein DCY13_03170 [Verrucomicrobiales bacterium]|nr:hypothetical protein [Verrucomicrobiales bacterium]
MNIVSPSPRLFRSLMLGAAGATLAGGAAHAQGDWSKRFRIGLVTAINVETEFAFGGQFGVTGSDPGQPGVPGLNHVYDDGYVRLDDTGNAGGFTSNWGYENPGQYDAASGTLTFRGTTSFTQNSTRIRTTEEPYYGVDLAYGGRLLDIGTGVFGWGFGFNVLPMKFEDRAPRTVAAERVVHRFSTGGIVVPQAPYQGGLSGQGPVISDLAQEISRESTTGNLTGTRQMEALAFEFRLGPNMQWHLGGRWAASLGAGAAMGVVSGDFDFNERIDFAGGGFTTTRGGDSSTELVFGGWGEALLYYRTDQEAELYVGAQYSIMDDATFGGSGREARLKLGNGIRFLAGIHWIF